MLHNPITILFALSCTALLVTQQLEHVAADDAKLIRPGSGPMTQDADHERSGQSLVGDKNGENVNENALQRWLGGMATKARDAIDAKLNPKRDWFALIRRLHNWFSKYKSIYDKSTSSSNTNIKLMTPVDVLAVEFARSDSELYGQKSKDLVAADEKRGAPEAGQKSIETIDHIYDTFDNLMQRLESIDLDDRRAVERQLAADGTRTSKELRASSEFREAMDRAKRIGVNTAEGVLANEATVLVRMALINVLAAHIGQMGGADPSGQLSQLTNLLLGATGPYMAAQYLADVNRRTLITMLGVLNPMARFKENVNQQQNVPGESDAYAKPVLARKMRER